MPLLPPFTPPFCVPFALREPMVSTINVFHFPSPALIFLLPLPSLPLAPPLPFHPLQKPDKPVIFPLSGLICASAKALDARLYNDETETGHWGVGGELARGETRGGGSVTFKANDQEGGIQ